MNSKDFLDSDSFSGPFSQPKDKQQIPPQDFSFSNQPLPPVMNFPQQQFFGNFMMNPMNGAYFPPYQNPYMNYGYNYGDQPFQSNQQPYYKKRYNGYNGYNGPRKNFGKPKVIYTAKPKEPLKPEKDLLAEDFTKLTLKDSPHTEKGQNVSEGKPSGDLENARFFVIKSFCEEDVHKAIKHNLWCSTRDGNIKLNDAFVLANNRYPIFLLFSVNTSGHFLGIAQMKSAVNFEENFPGWIQSQKWKGVFKIGWIYIKDIPNKEFRHLKNELNEGKPVPNSRDTQEIPSDMGAEVLKIFEGYKNQTSILDDFDHYEVKERKKEPTK